MKFVIVLTGKFDVIISHTNYASFESCSDESFSFLHYKDIALCSRRLSKVNWKWNVDVLLPAHNRHISRNGICCWFYFCLLFFVVVFLSSFVSHFLFAYCMGHINSVSVWHMRCINEHKCVLVEGNGITEKDAKLCKMKWAKSIIPSLKG